MIRESLRFEMGDSIQQLSAVAAGLDGARKSNDKTAEAMIRLRMAEADVSDEMLQLARVASGLDAQLATGTISAKEHAQGMRLVERQLAEAKAAGSGLGEAADQASGRLMKLGGALDVVSPQAGALARTAGDLLDGLSLVGSGSGLALVAVGALAAGFLALVVGTGAAVVGLLSLTQSSADAADGLVELQRLSGAGLVDPKAVAAVKDADAAMDAVGATSQAVGLAIAAEFAPAIREAAILAIELGLGLKDIVVSGAGAGQLVIDLGRALLEGLVSPIRAALDMLASLDEGLAVVAERLGQTGAAESYRAAAASLRGVVDEGLVGSAWDALSQRLGKYRDQAERLTAAQLRLNSAQKEAADITLKRVDLLDELLKDAEASLQEDIAGAGRAATTALTDFQEAMDGLVPPQSLSALDQLAGLEADLAIAFSRGEISAEQYAAALRQVADAKTALGNQALADKISGAVDLASNVGGAITSGSISGMVSAVAPAIGTAIAGPVGAAVGEAIGAATTFLEDLGAAGGSDAITANLVASSDNIVAGIEALPDLLLNGLPEVLNALGRDLIVELPEAFGEAMYEALENWWDNAKDRAADFLAGGEDAKSLLRRAAVNAVRAASAVATAGASEVALGVANAATDGAVKERLYGSDSGNARRTARASGQEAFAAHQAALDRRLNIDDAAVRRGVALVTQDADRVFNPRKTALKVT